MSGRCGFRIIYVYANVLMYMLLSVRLQTSYMVSSYEHPNILKSTLLGRFHNRLWFGRLDGGVLHKSAANQRKTS
jgi:hypothetical protein